MRRLSLILAVLICELPALAQTPRFSFGAMGGVRLSSGAPAITHDESPRYTVGAVFEVSFGEHLAAEVDALYKRLGSSYVLVDNLGLSGLPAFITDTRTRVNSVEIPILGKYYFGSRNAWDRFFVCTGYSFQHPWLTSTTAILQTPGGVYQEGLGPPGAPTVVGAVFGAGVARKAGPLTVSPAFRYTRWGVRFDGASRNQIEILLSLGF